MYVQIMPRKDDVLNTAISETTNGAGLLSIEIVRESVEIVNLQFFTPNIEGANLIADAFIAAFERRPAVIADAA